ncbi:MAG: SEL1-like repeat protein [Bacteroides sp.]|nr:SEL1-like repeat protein [Bacteroides sp.]MDE7441774.1 hypothetical protein [Muribaculaceae bacterium]
MAEHPKVVTDYYDSIKRLSDSNEQDAFDLTDKIMCCFAGRSQDDRSSGFSGINIVDNLTTSHPDTVPSNVFAQRLQRAIHEKKELRLDKCTTLESQYSMQPKLTDEGEVRLCQTKVETSYSGTTSLFNKRTEYLGIVDDKIVTISLNEMNMDVVGLTFEAARLFTLKKYAEAYATYQKILSMEPENINALYRLGIMTSKGKGTKKNLKEAIKLFDKAKSLVRPSKSDRLFDFNTLRVKADEAWYHLTHSSVV